MLQSKYRIHFTMETPFYTKDIALIIFLYNACYVYKMPVYVHKSQCFLCFMLCTFLHLSIFCVFIQRQLNPMKFRVDWTMYHEEAVVHLKVVVWFRNPYFLNTVLWSLGPSSISQSGEQIQNDSGGLDSSMH